MTNTLNTPIEAATELTRLLMAVIVFSVLPVVSARGGHIAVDLLDPLFRGLLQRLRDGAVHVSCGLMLIWPAMRAGDLAERARSYGDVTEYLGIPQFYPAWFIAVMAGIAALALIVRGIVALVAPRALAEAEGLL
jgi:TRAP-type C4-dicarboxylate transport system permease small subunit